MSWTLAALLAHFFYALGFILDKFLLAKPIRNPVVSAVLPGLLGGLAILLAPFGFYLLDFHGLSLAALAGGSFILALIFFFSALKAGEITRVVPFVGALVPIATLIFGYMFLGEAVYHSELLAFVFLMAGGILVIASVWKSFGFTMIGFATLSAFLFGFSFVMAKLVFLGTDFLNGFIWIRLGGLAISMLFLISPRVRRELRFTKNTAGKGGTVLFFGSKSVNGLATFLQSYAIAGGNVVLVNALQGTQYVYLLLIPYFLAKKWPHIFRDTYMRGALIRKVLAALLIITGLTFAVRPPVEPMTYGVTFSSKFARSLGLDSDQVYMQILDDLGARKLRLIAYWDEIEPFQGMFDFSRLDSQINEAGRRGAEIILVMGYKTPRWPECHVPGWARNADGKVKREEILPMLRTVVERYSSSPHVVAWQVENEPLFPFGECEILGRDFLEQEVREVRALDSKRPIMLTESGEMGMAWPYIARKSDIFGTTLYRRVYNRYFGYIEYWFIPEHFFRIKAFWAEKILGKKIMIAELQAEPWIKEFVGNVSLNDQKQHMNPKLFAEILDYASRTGFREASLWGAEWWYFLGVRHNDWSMWEAGRSAIQKYEL